MYTNYQEKIMLRGRRMICRHLAGMTKKRHTEEKRTLQKRVRQQMKSEGKQ